MVVYPQEKEAKIALIKGSLLAAFPNLKGIYLFGSQADNTDNEASDWDIALLMPYKNDTDAVTLWNTRWDLGGQLGQAVDLIDLHLVPILFRGEIIHSAKRIFCTDEYFCDLFETTCASMYCKYQEEIKDTLEDIKERGFVRYK